MLDPGKLFPRRRQCLLCRAERHFIVEVLLGDTSRKERTKAAWCEEPHRFRYYLAFSVSYTSMPHWGTLYLITNLNASKPSEYPPSRGKNDLGGNTGMVDEAAM